MTKRTISLLGTAVTIFLIAIAAINMAIKKYEKEPTVPAAFPAAQQNRQTERVSPESSAPEAPNLDIENEPPIPSQQPLSY